MAEFEVNSKPFDENELVDDVIEAGSAFEAALMHASSLGGSGPVDVYVRELGATETKVVCIDRYEVKLDGHYIREIAACVSHASFYAQRPEPQCHVLAREWMTLAFKHQRSVKDLDTKLRSVQLLAWFDAFVSDCIQERCHARN